MSIAARLASLAVPALCLLAPVGASAAAAGPTPELLSFGARAGLISNDGAGRVTLRTFGTHPARRMTTRPLRQAGRGIGPRRIAAGARPGSLLTVELRGGRERADSLTLRVGRASARGGRLVVRGRRVSPTRALRARHGFNRDDPRLPRRLRGLQLMLDTRPGGPAAVDVAGERLRTAVVFFLRAPGSEGASASDEGVPERVIAGGATTWLVNQRVSDVDFECTVLPVEERRQGVSIAIHSTLLDVTDDLKLVTVPEDGEVIELDDALYLGPVSFYWANRFTVDLSYASPQDVRFGISVNQSGSSSGTVEASCEGSAE